MLAARQYIRDIIYGDLVYKLKESLESLLVPHIQKSNVIVMMGITWILNDSLHAKYKVRKKAKIMNPYNQIPHLTQDTI